MARNAPVPLWKSAIGGAVFASIVLGFIVAPFISPGGAGDLCIVGAFGALSGPFLIWQFIRSLKT
jgi:hypothetical protein